MKCANIPLAYPFACRLLHEGENMLVIHSDECIDCGVCEPNKLKMQIKLDTDPEGVGWVEFNKKWSQSKDTKEPKTDTKNIQVKQTNLKNILKTNELHLK